MCVCVLLGHSDKEVFVVLSLKYLKDKKEAFCRDGGTGYGGKFDHAFRFGLFYFSALLIYN